MNENLSQKEAEEIAEQAINPNVEEAESWWWGYKHKNGHIQAKRYFSHQDLEEADESPFCVDTFGPFKATDRDDAIGILEKAFAIKFEPIPKQEVFDATGYDKSHD